MPKAAHHHHKQANQPVITLTPAEEIQHRATADEGRGGVEVVGLLGLAALVFSTGLLALVV